MSAANWLCRARRERSIRQEVLGLQGSRFVAQESEWGGERKVMLRGTQVALTGPKSH